MRSKWNVHSDPTYKYDGQSFFFYIREIQTRQWPNQKEDSRVDSARFLSINYISDQKLESTLLNLSEKPWVKTPLR